MLLAEHMAVVGHEVVKEREFLGCEIERLAALVASNRAGSSRKGPTSSTGSVPSSLRSSARTRADSSAKAGLDQVVIGASRDRLPDPRPHRGGEHEDPRPVALGVGNSPLTSRRQRDA